MQTSSYEVRNSNWRTRRCTLHNAWGDEEFYPDFVEKAAVLLVRLAKNHPLLDGNKRAAWVTLRVFVEMNDCVWEQYPDVDQAEQAVLAVASSAWDEGKTAEWLRGLLRPPAVGG
jgi:death on curing protein